jgi:hypothetical protein
MQTLRRTYCPSCGHPVPGPVERTVERLVFTAPGCHAEVTSPWDVVSAECGCASDCHDGARHRGLLAQRR